MQSDDISGLFGSGAPGAAANSQIRQGTVLTFSIVDGSNTVRVGASTLTNVPMLLTGAEVNYLPGDPILLLVLGNTYMILGKVAMVGSTQFASASVQSLSGLHSTTGQVFAVAFTKYDTVQLTVPVWANTASVVVIGSMSCSMLVSGIMQVNAGVTGQAFNAPAQTAQQAGFNISATQGWAGTVTGLVGGSTLEGQVNGSVNANNNSGNSSVSMLATFYKH